MWAIFRRVTISVVRLHLPFLFLDCPSPSNVCTSDSILWVAFILRLTQQWPAFHVDWCDAKSNTSRLYVKQCHKIYNSYCFSSDSLLKLNPTTCASNRVAPNLYKRLTKSIFIKKWLIYNLYWWPAKHEHSSQSQNRTNEKSLFVPQNPCHSFIDWKLIFSPVSLSTLIECSPSVQRYDRPI